MLIGSRFVDFYENECLGDGKAGSGTLTLSGADGEPMDGCRGGPLHPSGADTSRSVSVNGISGSGLVVELYATRDCPPESFLTGIAGDDCFTSSTGVGCHNINA